MKKLYFILLLLVIFCTQAWADDTENRLYQSCVSANASKDNNVQAMCACVAKKLASEEMEVSSHRFKLENKEEYIEGIIKIWNSGTTYQYGTQLSEKDSKIFQLLFDLSYFSSKELGLSK